MIDDAPDVPEDENDPRCRCRICGLSYYPYMPWEQWGDELIPTHDICACCGGEFGYDDCWLPAILMNRQRWLEAGAKWNHPKFRPEGWNLEDQLRQIPPEFL